MPLKLRKYDAEVRDPSKGNTLVPLGLLGSDALEVIEEKKTKSLNELENKRSSSLFEMETKRTTSLTDLENKRVSSLNSIPENYTALSLQVSKNEEALNNIDIIEQKEFVESDFIRGSLFTSSDGSVITDNYLYRICSKDIHHATETTFLTVDKGYMVYVCYYDKNGSYLIDKYKNADPYTSLYIIPKDSYFRLLIRKQIEDRTEEANISEFMSKVHFQYYVLNNTVNLLRSAYKYLNLNEYNLDASLFGNGSISTTTTGKYINNSYLNRITTVNIQKAETSLFVKANPDFTAYVAYYETNEDDSYIKDTSNDWIRDVVTIEKGKYFRIMIRRITEISGETADIEFFSKQVTFVSVNDNLQKRVGELENRVDFLETNDTVFGKFDSSLFLRGSINTSGSGIIICDERFKHRVVSKDILSAITDIQLIVEDGFRFYLTFYGIDNSYDKVTSNEWITTDYVIPKGSNYRIIIAKVDENTSEVADIEEFVSKVIYSSSKSESIISTKLKLEENLKKHTADNAYYIDSCLMKHWLDVTRVAILKYGQDFLIYDNKFYIVGSNKKMAVFNSMFVLEDDLDIDVGHGNGFHLGSNGIGYASGWNDNKIYCVDLNEKTVVNTIELPTTGYTTAVVDDINSIAYIFQRDSYPATESRYNFIVYDYENKEVLHRNKTRAFAAMQGVDLYNGSIFVTNGFGTENAPNYYVVYDKMGNEIGEYFFPMIIGEPEGVSINRDTHELFVSMGSAIYKIELQY